MNAIRNSMATVWPAIRISLVLVSITASIILIADLLGIVPNQTKFELENRKQLSESFAVLFSTMATDQDIGKIRTVLSKIVIREEQILSAGFRLKSGRLLFETGPHSKYWGEFKGDKSTTTHVLVPIFKGRKKLGSIELRFKSLASDKTSEILNNQLYRLLLFVIIFGFLSFLLFVLRTLRQIDPASVIPDRVNAAFDTLAEGVVILDDKEQIVLANKAFSEIVQRSPKSLLGFKLSELGWKSVNDESGDIIYPWVAVLSTGISSVDDKLTLEVSRTDKRTMIVNSAPINDLQGNCQGILLTFDDVTELELQKQQLQVMVSDLESSQKEIERQNQELHYLATRDSLTGSLNRRSFYEKFDVLFAEAKSKKLQLCCLMVDIDHFKLVNDNYGHAVGDEVIKLLANILESSTRDEDIVGRYGGEEFCVVLPGLTIDEAVSVAERIRLKIKDDSAAQFVEGPRVTASLGVASIFDKVGDSAELNEKADQALYVAKESGRNRVVKWTSDTSTNTLSEKDKEEQINKNPANKISISEHSGHAEEILKLQAQIQQLENVALNFSNKLQHEQNYDKLTGLPNQALFYDRLNQALERSAREGKFCAILVIDFDLIELLNDNIGIENTGELCIALAKKLEGIFRKTDSLILFQSTFEQDFTVSRFERDEFGILISDFEDINIVPWVIKRIFDEIGSLFLFKEFQLKIACNVGISIYPDDAKTSEELISHAITAKAFTKKDSNKNSYHFFDPEMQNASAKRFKLEMEIRRAIDNEEWVLFYQPKLDIATGQIKGVEALIRWNHPQRGILGPFEFIELAEERGFITEIGEWVIKTACQQIKRWTDQGLDLKVAVNLSSLQLCQPEFSNLVLDIIQESNILHRQLELEITETTLMDNFEVAITTLKRLHCRGICISIDDFGTGYSSLGYLKNLPVNTLKIDRIFITDICNDKHDNNIVNTIISMAHGLDLIVIAEGVETHEQYELLKQMSCDEIQGYLLSKPIDAASLSELLLRQPGNYL